MADHETDDWGDPIVNTTHDLEKEPLVGIYTGFKEIESEYGLSKLHQFSTEDGPAALWGKTHLNRLLEGREGELVKVKLTGNSIPIKGRNDMIEYALYSKGRPNTPPRFPGEPD
jgi:hypothetical protein